MNALTGCFEFSKNLGLLLLFGNSGAQKLVWPLVSLRFSLLRLMRRNGSLHICKTESVKNHSLQQCFLFGWLIRVAWAPDFSLLLFTFLSCSWGSPLSSYFSISAIPHLLLNFDVCCSVFIFKRHIYKDFLNVSSVEWINGWS